MADEGATRGVLGAVGPGAVDELPAEEHRGATRHGDRDRFGVAGERVDVRVAVVVPVFAGHFLGAVNVVAVRTGHDPKAAVVERGRVDGGPRGDAGRGCGEQVKIVLVHALTFGAGWLKIIHSLDDQRGLT